MKTGNLYCPVKCICSFTSLSCCSVSFKDFLAALVWSDAWSSAIWKSSRESYPHSSLSFGSNLIIWDHYFYRISINDFYIIKQLTLSYKISKFLQKFCLVFCYCLLPDESILIGTGFNFVPSIKMVSPEISPISNNALDISARIRLEQGAKWILLNLANVAWSGAGEPSRRNIKLISLLQFSSMEREE